MALRPDHREVSPLRTHAVATVAALLLLAAPGALAQNPSLTVEITDAPAAFGELGSNDTATAQFNVVVTLSNVVCSQATQIPVTITATPKQPAAFFTAAPEPAQVNISVEAGPHGSPPVGEPARGTQPAGVRVATTDVTANASIPVEIVATAEPPAGCQGVGGNPSAATSAPVTIFANATAPPPVVVEEPPVEETPGPGLVAGLVAAAAAAVLMRRRQA